MSFRPKALKILILLAVVGATSEVRAEALSWEECVREASQGNPELRAAQEQLRRAQALLGASRSDFFPQLQGFTGYNVSNTSAFNATPNNETPGVDVDIGTRRQFELGVSLDQNIFAGLKTQKSYQRSKSQVAEAEANESAVKSQVSFDLKVAFARLLFFQRQIEVVRRIVERRQENVRFVELRFDGGRENQGSVLRNRALLEQARFDLVQTGRSLKVAQRELAKVLGRNYQYDFEGLRVKGDFDTNFPKAPPDFSVLVPENPEHRRAQAQVDVAHADVGIARGDLLPSVDANASVGIETLNTRGDGSLWSAGVNLTYPFFTGGRDIYELRAAKLEKFRTQQAMRAGDNQIAVDLKQAYADFKDAVDRIRVQQGFLKASEVRAEIGRSQYANGLISYQDWDLVENDLIQNQQTILESLRDALIAEAGWERAQGKGAFP